MSGTRQHFIPQFLQRGFSSNRSSDASFTWVYRKGKDPFETNILNSGVEGNFYTLENDPTLDNAITDLEGELASLLSVLRTLPTGEINDPRIPKLIAHLAVRTRHLRQSYLNASGYILSQLIDLVGDQQRFLAYFESRVRKDPSMIRRPIMEEFSKRGIDPKHLEQAFPLIERMLPQFFREIGPHLSAAAAKLKQELPQRLSLAIKSGHVNGLLKSVCPVPRIQEFDRYTFTLVDVPAASLILGDSGVLFSTANPTRPFRAIVDGSMQTNGVFLPLSTTRLLIGTLGENPSTQVPSNLTTWIAKCSLEFFVADHLSDDLKAKHELIGESAAPLDELELQSILDQQVLDI